MLKLNSLLDFIPVYNSLLKDVNHQRKFLNFHILPIIDKYRSENDGTLDEEDFTKIMKYYGFGVPSIVGEFICTLRGQPMTEKERLCSTFQGALTGLYDDFFDKTGMKEEQILEMMHDPFAYHPDSSLERLFIEFMQNVHKNLVLKDYFNHCFKNVFNAQKKSLKQSDPQISYEDILEITFEKGGHSLLFYRSAFTFLVTKGEANALYQLGSLMQLGNDIFDVWKDQQAGIRTPVTAASHLEIVREAFRKKMKAALQACDDAGFDPKNLHRFRRKFILAISRCYVCMDHLEKLEKRSGGTFRPSEYSRKDMICDMEKTINILKAISYYLATN